MFEDRSGISVFFYICLIKLWAIFVLFIISRKCHPSNVMSTTLPYTPPLHEDGKVRLDDDRSIKVG